MYIIAPNTFQKLFPIRIVYSHFLFNRKEKGLAVKIAFQKRIVQVQKKVNVALVIISGIYAKIRALRPQS